MAANGKYVTFETYETPVDSLPHEQRPMGAPTADGQTDLTCVSMVSTFVVAQAMKPAGLPALMRCLGINMA